MRSSLSAAPLGSAALVAVVLCACSPVQQTVGVIAAPEGGVVPPGFGARARVTFDNRTQLAAPLLDFPVLVTIDVPALLAQTSATEFGEFALVDPGTGAALPHEVDGEWNADGTNAVWVRFPRIEAVSTDIFVYLYFAGNEPFPAVGGVFDSGFAGVFHMGGASLKDSSPRGNDGDDSGSAMTEGVVGGARSFDGTTSAVIGSNGFPDGSAAFTVCAWLAPGTDPMNLPAFYYALSFGSPATDAGYVLGLHADSLFCGQGFAFGDESAIVEDVFSSTAWLYACCTVDDTNTRAYVAGRPVTVLNGTPRPLWPIEANAATIGAAPSQAGWIGSIDELRVSAVARSEDWLRAEYLTMQGEFASVGNAEVLP